MTCVCTPPPGTPADQAAVFDGLTNGTRATFSSDHSPWRFADRVKHGGAFNTVPNGIPGIETRLALLFSEAVGSGLSLAEFVERTSTALARIFGRAPRKRVIAVESDADLALWDLMREATITNAMLHHACDYTPDEGRVRGWPLTTIARGEVLWHEGRVFSRPGRGRLVPADLPVASATAPQSWMR